MFGLDLTPEWLQKEWAVIRGVKFTFVIWLVISASAISFILNEWYRARLDGYKDELYVADRKISELKSQIGDIAERRPEIEASQSSSGGWLETQVPVSGQYYSNEVVQVDGKIFVDCWFTNVTLEYAGTGGWSFIRAHWDGEIHLKTSNKAVQAFAKLNEAMKNIPNLTYLGVGEVDASGHISITEELNLPNSNAPKKESKDVEGQIPES